ncbi:flavin reductase family protein [Actinokineospora guangxiensis]|uniref:Flavin reductase family protein n=1 Tax=Actinokineospora guangxiensis TaxID=1490288 RepID=A0ABW0ES31_9PSEU
MAAFPAGVTIVTATTGSGDPHGMTCSSVSSVSLLPPVLLVCLNRRSRTLPALLATSKFAVNFLHSQAREAARLFSTPVPDRFEQVRWELSTSHAGPHLLDEAHTVADCRVVETTSIGDHTVVFGEVFDIHRVTSDPPDPLLYGLRDYWSLHPSRNGAAPPA